jgi:hypothetical protein
MPAGRRTAPGPPAKAAVSRRSRRYRQDSNAAVYGPLRVGKDNLDVARLPIAARCLPPYCRGGSGPGHRPALDDWSIRDRSPLRLRLNAPFAPEHAARIAIALPSDITGLFPFHPRALIGYELDVKPRDLGDNQKPSDR